MSDAMTHDELQDLLGAYALDAVDADEADAVERHLASCAKCRAEVAEHREVVALLGEAGAADGGSSTGEPSGDLWDRIAGSLSPEGGPSPVSAASAREADRVPAPAVALGKRPDQASRRAPRRWLAPSLAAVAAAVIAVLGVQLARQGDRIDRLQAEARQGSLTEQAALASADPDATRVTFASTGSSGPGYAVVLPDGRGYLVLQELPALPDGRTYQLWANSGGEMVSVAVLGPRPGTYAFTFSGSMDGMAVSSEPAGGSVTPSLPAVTAGDVKTA